MRQSKAKLIRRLAFRIWTDRPAGSDASFKSVYRTLKRSYKRGGFEIHENAVVGANGKIRRF